ncbi:MAG: PD-(D/E)XK nuclease family protein [Syntrophobacteraceae bacterium]
MTNQDLQNRLLVLLENGYTVLAETERLVHQVQRQFRLRRIEEGKPGWDAPKIFTLNRWMENLWMELWPEEMPASSSFLRWQFLKDCTHEAPPPEPSSPDIELIHLLDESFEQCLRFALDPAGGQDVSPLIGWRRQIWRSFDDRLARSGLFHPARLPEKIAQRLAGMEREPSWSRMAFVGFEFAGHWEKYLLEELQKKVGAVFFALPAGKAQPSRLVYSDPEQEITGLMENLLLAVREQAPHEIAVVLCDSEFYSPAISNLLRDILGEPIRGQLAAYNLCPDLNMCAQGLYNAAVLPIRCALGGEKRNDLFTFLRSPYYGSFSRWNRRLSLWDRTWREKSIESGIDPLLEAVRDSAEEIFPDGCSGIRAAIAPFLEAGVKTVFKWAETLRRIWAALQFPVLANELDRITWDNLVQIISEFATVFGNTSLSAHEFFEFLAAAASHARVQKSGFEDAGIQVLGRLDARGLSFEKIFIPGLVSGSFPQPVRSLPLLSSSERPKVLGGTIESQFAFARHLYANFLAAAPQIALSRPAIAKDGQICIPSSFWTEDGAKKIDAVIPWKHSLPAMQRARWVRQSISKITFPAQIESVEAFCQPDRSRFQIQPLPIVNQISVSELQSALLCPARYFFRYVLGLEELDEFEPGIPALQRGRNVHSILASFVLRAREKLCEANLEFEGLSDLLKKTITDVIGSRLSQAVWQVELDRLIGKPGHPGLFLKWLAAERERILDGWSWMAVERPFEDLEIYGCQVRLKGRLDRIDSHPERGIICWDYKTGRLPRRTEVIDRNNEPQLPAYLLALSRGKVTGAPKADDNCGAGFIELRSAGSMKHQVMFDPAEQHGPFLKDWEECVATALNSIFAGDVPPLWLKEGRACEENCVYGGICGSA